MLVTIIGGRGFIGSNLAKFLETKEISYWLPEKNEPSIFKRDLGVVIYCAGNGDCSNKPFNVVNANSLYLTKLLESACFEKLIYLSSTRLYLGAEESTENTNLVIESKDSRRLFNLSKLLAEEICLKSGRDTIIVRPSNVYGLAPNSNLFLPSITKDAVQHGRVNMYVDKTYAKDYVSIEDVTAMIYNIMINKKLGNKIYNIASGNNITAAEIAKHLKELTSCDVFWHENNVTDQFPIIDINLLKNEFNFEPRLVLDDLKILVQNMQLMLNNENKV